MTQLALENAKH